jgi:hypothetical protein
VSWFRSRRGPDLPPLPEAPKVADLPEARLQSAGRYLGTTVDGVKVTAHGLGGHSSVRVLLSDEALDVVRLAGPIRIPVRSLRGARHHDGAMVVSWEHGDRVLETTLRLTDDLSLPGTPGDKHGTWVRRISKLARRPG